MKTKSRYRHTLDICFSLEASTPNPGELSRLEVIQALLARVASVIATDDFPDAIGHVDIEELEQDSDDWLKFRNTRWTPSKERLENL